MSRKNKTLAGFGVVVTLFLAMSLYYPDLSPMITKFSNSDGNIQNPSAMVWEPLIGSDYGNVVGIDFGSTRSRIVAPSNTKSTLLVDEYGKNSTPSCVAFTENGVLIGQEAVDHALNDSINTIFDIRRFIGRTYTELSDIINEVPNIIVEKNGKPYFVVQLNGQRTTLAPEEIAAHIFTKLKIIAEEYYGSKVLHAVITIPEYFSDNQRAGMKHAALIAGLNVLRTINEPTAAAIAYDFDRQEGEVLFLVYNVEMGHSDLTLENMDCGIYEIMANESTKQLGGSILDHALANQLCNPLNILTDMDTTEADFFSKCVNGLGYIEEALSITQPITFDVEGYPVTVTLDQVKNLYARLFSDNILQMIARLLKEGNVTMEAIDRIILTGDSSHTSKIQASIKQLFPGKIVSDFLTNEAFVSGAARQAWVLTGEEPLLDCCSWLDFNRLSLGIEINGGVMENIIPKNTVLPTRKSKLFTTTRDDQESVVIKIFGGERKMTKNNIEVGILELPLIPTPKRVAQIRVAFEIDVNMILRVSIKDEITENETSAILGKPFDSYEWDKVDEIIMIAAENAEEDLASKERALEQFKDGNIDGFGVVPVTEAVIPYQQTSEPSWFCSMLPGRWCSL